MVFQDFSKIIKKARIKKNCTFSHEDANFLVLKVFVFLNLIAMGYRQHFGKNHAKQKIK